MLTALMVWGKLVKAYPICYAHTKLMEARTSQAVVSNFLNHIPLSTSFPPKYVPLKYVCIYVIVISRMCEIYLHLAVAPIPMATITNREFGESGKNYLKTIFSFVLQAFFILLCIGLFKHLVTSLANTIGADGAEFSVITPQMFQIVAFGVCMILLMFKSQSLAKALVGAH